MRTDVEEVLKHYQRFALEFSHTPHIVRLEVRAQGRLVPNTDQESLEIEALHNVCDLYLWLAQRFPGSFPDAKAAAAEAAHAARLVDSFLAKGGKRLIRAQEVEGEEEEEEEEEEEGDGKWEWEEEDWEQGADDNNEKEHTYRRL